MTAEPIQNRRSGGNSPMRVTMPSASIITVNTARRRSRRANVRAGAGAKEPLVLAGYEDPPAWVLFGVCEHLQASFEVPDAVAGGGSSMRGAEEQGYPDDAQPAKKKPVQRPLPQ